MRAGIADDHCPRGTDLTIPNVITCLAYTGEDADMSGHSVLTSKIEAEVELLERHVVMLNAIKRHEPIGIIRLAELLDIPQHKVRYSLRILEQEGLINPSPEGAVTTERLSEFYARVVSILERMEGTVGKLKGQLEEESRKSTKD